MTPEPTQEHVYRLDQPERCPACGSRIDAHSDLYGQDDPKPGDVSLCLICAEVMIYKDDLSLRVAVGAERDEIIADPGVARALAALILLPNRPTTPRT